VRRCSSRYVRFFIFDLNTIFSQAPVIQWNKQSTQGANKDKWSQTYVAKTSSPQSTPQKRIIVQRSSPSLRPQDTTPLSSRVSEHIASATNSLPLSSVKHSGVSGDAILSAPDVISSPYSSELSKVYGSVLQPKGTLESFHCHVCSALFPPDATIYPDPADASGGRFMCRSCFSQGGGSRGICVECSRPVLILKSEGGFVENAGRVWHKKCFHCSGCGESIGDNPVVDLLGRPSCAECFDTCLNRRHSPGKTRTSAPKECVGSLGGCKPASAPSPGKPRKGSSTIEELEQVLGIRRPQSAPDPNPDQAASPPEVASMPRPNVPRSFSPSSLPPLTNDNSTRPAQALPKDVLASSSSSQCSTPSRPISVVATGQTKATPEAIDVAKKKSLKQTGSATDKSPKVTPTRGGHLEDDTLETPTKSPMRYSDFRLLRHQDSTSSIRTDRDSVLSLSSAASIPSLASDHSDTATISSEPSSPPSLGGEQEDLVGLLSASPSGPPIRLVSSNTRSPDLSSETRPSSVYAHTPLPDAKCAKCTLPLFSMKYGRRYVSVPEPSSTGSSPRMYHADCFRCRICNGLFEEKEAGRAVFVRGVRGACHLSVGFHFISGEQR
jgi:LIM domain-containing protein